jgi:hypothetical protein
MKEFNMWIFIFLKKQHELRQKINSVESPYAKRFRAVNKKNIRNSG